MLDILLNIITLIFGLYLIYGGYIGKKLVDDNNLLDPESKIPSDKLFLSQMIIGLLIVVYSLYVIYNLLGN
jgi:TRAP-type C4-dicarboxylate transport system permease small subunit